MTCRRVFIRVYERKGRSQLRTVPIVHSLGYEATGKDEDAIREYEQVLARGNERSHSYDTPAFHKIVDAHYRLGTLFESAGQSERARSYLQQFLKYWSQPDSNLEIYRDAERRLRTLTVSVGH